jgi:hypothetical protein
MDALAPKLLAIEITVSDETRGYWLDQPTSPADRRAELLAAPILVVPSPAGEGETPTFPNGTAEFLDLLRELSGGELAIAIASTAEAYQELSLHGKAWRLPKFIITSVALPILLGVLSNRLDALLPGHAHGDIAEATVLVEAPNHRVLKVTYKGDPAKLAEFLARELPGYLMTIDPDSPVLELETGAPDAGKPPADSPEDDDGGTGA